MAGSDGSYPKSLLIRKNLDYNPWYAAEFWLLLKVEGLAVLRLITYTNYKLRQSNPK